MPRKLRLLVTAFGPFPGVPANPSQRTARDLLRLKRPALADLAIRLEILPTRWDALARLDALLAGEPFDAVLLLGVATRRRRVCLETRAVNGARPVPDAGGRHPRGRRLMPEGPEVLASTVSARPLVEMLKRSGIAACTSRDAGRYLCNAAYFHALADVRRRARGADELVPVLFVHLPGRAGIPAGTTRERMARALSSLLAALAADARRRGRARLHGNGILP